VQNDFVSDVRNGKRGEFKLPLFCELTAEGQSHITFALKFAPESVAVFHPDTGEISHWLSRGNEVIDIYGCYAVFPHNGIEEEKQ